MNTNTSSLFARATDILRDDMAANARDAAIQVLGGVMTELLRRNPEIAEKIVPEGKNLKGAMTAMKDVAAKNKHGNWGCLDALSGVKVALEYYGIAGIRDMQLVHAIAESLGGGMDPGFGLTAEAGADPGFSAQIGAPDTAAAEVDELDIDALLGGVS